MNDDLTADRARTVLRYEAETGRVFWCQSLSKRAAAGREAGTINGDGRRQVSIDGRRYLTHRIVWLIVHGAWPAHEIDHIDGDKLNNRVENLRDATRTINAQNTRHARRHSRSGLLGAFWFKRDATWVSKIRIGGHMTHLGYFDTPEKAHAAFVAAKRKHQPGCTI